MILFVLPFLALIAAIAGAVVFAAAYVFIRRPPAEANRFGSPSPSRTVVGALGRAILHMFDFGGRANRKDFWTLAIAEGLAGLCLLFILPVMFMMNAAIDVSAIAVWALLILLPLGAICSLSMAIRRLHDVNRSGWWVLLIGVFGYFILLYWFLQPQQRGAAEQAHVFT